MASPQRLPTLDHSAIAARYSGRDDGSGAASLPTGYRQQLAGSQLPAGARQQHLLARQLSPSRLPLEGYVRTSSSPRIRTPCRARTRLQWRSNGMCTYLRFHIPTEQRETGNLTVEDRHRTHAQKNRDPPAIRCVGNSSERPGLDLTDSPWSIQSFGFFREDTALKPQPSRWRPRLRTEVHIR